MKLTLCLLALLPEICFAQSLHQDIVNAIAQKTNLDAEQIVRLIQQQQKNARHTWDYKFEYLKAKQSLHYLHLAQYPGYYASPKKSKRASPNASESSSSSSSNTSKTDTSSANKPVFLPPPWSQDSPLDSPYPLSGLSPWSDGGRSQMIDNIPDVQEIPWRVCPPRLLDCRKCPRDPQCRRPQLPWWQLEDDGSTNTFPADDNPDSTLATSCTLARCDANRFSSCGANARCVAGHCICELGYKGDAVFGNVVRGFDELQSVTIWVDPGIACDVPCDTLSCKEVPQNEVCFDGVSRPHADGTWGPDVLETEQTGGGAVKVPSVDVIREEDSDGDSEGDSEGISDGEEAQDYVEGEADPGSVDEAT